MNKIFTLLFLLFCLLSFEAEAQTVKNTNSFITYFAGIKNVTCYFKIRDTLQKWGTEIKKSDKLTSDQKHELEVYYTNVQAKTQALYGQLLSDLTNTDKRKEIRKNVDTYVSSINGRFDDINTAYQSFKTKYSSISGAPKGALLLWVIQQFLLPIAKSFVNEIINDAVRNQMETRLKPILVLKNWSDL